jgi:hypothetical protein
MEQLNPTHFHLHQLILDPRPAFSPENGCFGPIHFTLHRFVLDPAPVFPLKMAVSVQLISLFTDLYWISPKTEAENA